MLNYAMPLRVRPKIMFVFPHHSTHPSSPSDFLSFLIALKFFYFLLLSKLIRSTRFIRSGRMSSACDMSPKERESFFNEYQIE
jgi:hypothetical protein